MTMYVKDPMPRANGIGVVFPCEPSFGPHISVNEHGTHICKARLLPFRDVLLRPADHTGAHASDGGTWSQRIYARTPHLLFFSYLFIYFLITLVFGIQLRSFLPAVQALY